MTNSSTLGTGARRLLLTGATGFIGRFLLGRLLDEGFEVAALVRAPSDAEAAARLPEFGGRRGLATIAGDVREPLFGRSPKDFAGVGAVLHLAAQPKLAARASLDDMRALHAGAARTLAEVAEAGLVRRVFHFSTAFVPAPEGGTLPEAPADALPEGANPYETTKAEAERVVRELLGARAEILRPAIVIPPPEASAERIASSPLGAFLAALRPDAQGRAVIPADPLARPGFCRLEDIADFALARLRDEREPSRTRFWNLVPEAGKSPSFGELARLAEGLGMFPKVVVDPARRNRLLETWAPYMLRERRWDTALARAFIAEAGLPEPRVLPADMGALLRTWRDARPAKEVA